ncbi:phage antirepressor [Limosilactobacillus reuteri]|uniref:phage antirepressor n=1 Tax=Limosilactobacillus reuteri TaxID=1598 RepID=UPI0021A50F43|nr:phage antirepressor KilAC domain-containing protein [Limosilactobacillus reuteri]MCT3188951.1 phage repressor protein/antirepressor Ant [Limosilactobacillus reuteri]MCT3197428.1 phage repressor protein/antirepressor Ant [Limosilactobacillus reuteri]
MQQLFNFNGQQVRTVTINDEPYFVGKDVATNLKYRQPADAIRNHVQPEDKGVYKLSTPGGEQRMTVINESGLYDLIFDASRQSKNSEVRENARKFRHWVTSEVLPAIRKHGAYMTPQTIEKALLNPDTIINLATQLKKEQEQRKQLQAENEQMKPKALFADSVAASTTTVLVGELAKIMRGNGIEIGANRLFRWMREHGYLINRKGSDWNMPTQKVMNLELFKIKETTINHADGTTSISKTPKVTGKGQQYFINKFLSASVIEA